MMSDTQVNPIESDRLYYKLVRNIGGQLTSLYLIGLFPIKYITTYEVNVELWTCEVKTPKNIHVIRMNDIDKYWTYTKKKQSINLIPRFCWGQDDGLISVQTLVKPQGTIGVDSVILRERIR